MRIHPIIVEVMREPIDDDLLPLSKPIVGISGKVYNELPVPKGTMVALSAFGYNLCVISLCGCRPLDMVLTPVFYCRNQDLWGPDAHQFRPERWFEMKEQVESPVGVYGNLYVWSSIRMIWY